MKILNIILCDDDRFILKLSEEEIKKQISLNELKAQICCKSTNTNEVLSYLKNNEGNYLIFLDLDFGHGKLNGIDVAKQIKAITSSTKIVFVTNYYEMAMKVLSSGVEPFGFIEKSTDIRKLSNSYIRYIQMAINAFGESDEDKDFIELVIGISEVIKVDKNQILYLESEKSISHGISYHTMDGSCLTVRDTMENCMNNLGDEFIRVHRSFLVNRRYMVSLNGTMIHLADGEEIPCSVRKIREVKKCLK